MMTTREAANALGLTVQRIRQLISRGELQATKVGRDWIIDRKDLNRVTRRPPGRPPKGE